MPLQASEPTKLNPYPPRLRRLARSASVPPETYLVDLLAKHISYSAAAEEAEVTRQTIWNWCQRLGIKR